MIRHEILPAQSPICRDVLTNRKQIPSIDVLRLVPQSDVMCSAHVPQAHIINEATSLPKAASFARQGKHH